jgi:hypothetical protein
VKRASSIWATGQTGKGSQDLGGIAVDGSGSSYVVGTHNGTSIFGTTTLVSQSDDVFLTRIDSSGSFQWAVGAGGASSDAGGAIRLDSAGAVTITGRFVGTATFGTTTLGPTLQGKFFVAQLDASGSFAWASTSSDSGSQWAYDIALDSSGGSFVCGLYQTALALGSSVFAPSTTELFVAKADSSGSYLWGASTTATSASKSLYAQGIAVDASGDIVVGGTFEQERLFGSKLLSVGPVFAVFVWKLSPPP